MASPARVTHRSLDGTRVVYQGAFDLTVPFTAVADVAVPGHVAEFSAGIGGFAEQIAGHMGVTDFSDEFSFQGGRLRVGEAVVDDPVGHLTDHLVLGVWEGRAHSMFAPLYNVGTSGMLGLFNSVAITEHADGISISPRRELGARFTRSMEVLKGVPELGELIVTRLTRETARVLPAWAGTRVSSGELFHDTMSDGRPYFLMATPTAVVTVLPGKGTTAGRLPALLNGLHVEVLA